MKLTTRLLCFFLVAIAVVLLAFDGVLFGLAAVHLDRQVNERIDRALATLCAACEVHTDTVEWEPEERAIHIVPETGPDRFCWTVRDLAGKMVDCSANFDGDKSLANEFAAMAAATADWQGEPWRTGERTLLPSHKPGAQPEMNAAEAAKQFDGLHMTAGCSLAPMQSSLRTLGLTLAAISVAVWISAALVGRRLCRSALAPVLQMTDEAERITADDLARRLPLPGTGDEVEQLAKSFNGLLTRVQEAYERQRRFTGDASHQLRTPLTVMLGQVEVALRRERSTEEYVRTMDIVRRRIIELQQITEMLLFLSRADAETPISDSNVVDAYELLGEAVERWETHPRGADLQIPSPQGGEERNYVRVHRPLFAQLLDNIIDNALKYSPTGTPVVLRAARGPNRVRLIVQDQGPGIPVDELPQVFAPFFRGREARRNGRQGVGLGLAVAQRIAEALGATITVEPSTASGACFVITLPTGSPGPDSGREPSESNNHEEVLPACLE